MTKTTATHTIRSRSFALILTFLAPALAGLSACGVDEGGTTEAPDEALTLPPGPPILTQCVAKAPDATGARRSFTVVHTPTTYGTSGCPKAYVVDATPPALYTDEETELDWSDPHPRTEVQCSGGTLKLVLMSKAPGDIIARNEGTFEVPLLWDATQQQCLYGRMRVEHRVPLPGSSDPELWRVITFREKNNGGQFLGLDITPVQNFNGRTLRLVASALTPAGSTQPMKIWLY